MGIKSCRREIAELITKHLKDHNWHGDSCSTCMDLVDEICGIKRL